MQETTHGEFRPGSGSRSRWKTGPGQRWSPPMDGTPAAKRPVSCREIFITTIDGDRPFSRGLTLEGRRSTRLKGTGAYQHQAERSRRQGRGEADRTFRSEREIHPGQAGQLSTPKGGGTIGYIRIRLVQRTNPPMDCAKAIVRHLERYRAGRSSPATVVDLRNNPNPGRPARPGGLGVDHTFMARGEVVSTRGPQPRGNPALTPRMAADIAQRAAAGRVDQWRLGVGIGDRGWRVA